MALVETYFGHLKRYTLGVSFGAPFKVTAAGHLKMYSFLDSNLGVHLR